MCSGRVWNLQLNVNSCGRFQFAHGHLVMTFKHDTDSIWICIFIYIYRWYCWWLKSYTSWYGSLSHYLQGFIHSRWCRISSINSSIGNARNAALSICPIHFSMVWTTKHRTTPSVSIVRLPLQTLRWFRVFEWVHLGCNVVWDMFMKGSFPSNHIKQNITLK